MMKLFSVFVGFIASVSVLSNAFCKRSLADDFGVEQAVAAVAEALISSNGDSSIMTRLRIPKSVVAKFVSKDFKHTKSVDRVVLGVRSIGNAQCVGHVHCDFVENPNVAEIQCRLSGSVVSDTSGRSGPAIIRSHGVTTYTAQKDILFDGAQFYSRPATVASKTRITLSDVASTLPGLRGRIVKRVANQQALESLPQAQIVSGQITERDLVQQIDAEFNTHLVALNRELNGVLSSVGKLSRSNKGRVNVRTYSNYIELDLGGRLEAIATPRINVESLASEPIELWIHFPDRKFSKVLFTNIFSETPLWLAQYLPSSPFLSLVVEKQVSVASNKSWVVLLLSNR